MIDETASQVLERYTRLKKTVVELYNTDHRFRAQADSAVAHAMNEHGPINPERAEQAAHDIARNAVVFAMGMILDADAELKHTRLERDRFRDLALQGMVLAPHPLVVSAQGIETAPADETAQQAQPER